MMHAHSMCPLKRENLSWHPQWIPICPAAWDLAPLPFPRRGWWVLQGWSQGVAPAGSVLWESVFLHQWEALWLPPPQPLGEEVGGCGLRGVRDRGPDESSSAKREVQTFFKSNLIKRSWAIKTYSKLMNWDSQCKREYSFSPSHCR